MNTHILKAACAAALAMAPVSAFATAQVTYIDTSKMSDVPRQHSDLENMKYVFNEHLNKLSEQLPAGQVLKIEFLDIDLAGDEFPRVAIRDVRVMKGQADWPRMHFRYSVEQDGKVVTSGEAKIQNPAYQQSLNMYDRDLYGYEKQMLDDWFRKELLHKR